MPLKLSKRGFSTGAHTVSLTPVNYTVVAVITNATRIAGRIRKHGDTFDAIPRVVESFVREGVIAPTSTLGH